MDGILPTTAANNAQLLFQQQYNQQAGQSGMDMQRLATQIQTKIPFGINLLAQVIGNDKNGNIIVRANGSDLLLSSPLALAKGAQLQIRLDTVSGNIIPQLLGVDGKLPVYRPQDTQNQPQAQRTNADGSVTLKLMGFSTQVAEKITEAPVQQISRVDSVTLSSPVNIVRGLVVQASPEIMQGVRVAMAGSAINEKLSRTMPSDLKPGMEASVKIMGSVPEPRPQAQTNNAALPAPVPNPALEDEAVQTQNSVLKGQEWMKPQGQPQQTQAWMGSFAPTIKPSPAGNIQLNALVMETSQGGEMTVETKLGLIQLDATTNGRTAAFPKGTEILLEIEHFSEPEMIPARRPENPSQMEREWSLLKSTLGDNKTEANKLAGIEHHFGAKLINFLNAVQKGDAETWLGAEFLDSLDDLTRAQLVNKLNGDLANLRGLMTETPMNNWQTVLFPVFDGRELNQARLHVKKFKDESALSADGTGTRFIVELETSFYGEMQFDGLIRRQIPQKSFDLIIRTHEQLDTETQQEIRQIFNVSQDIAKFRGNIEFATNPQFPVEPWKELLNKKTQHNSILG